LPGGACCTIKGYNREENGGSAGNRLDVTIHKRSLTYIKCSQERIN
jgi:hypothetical protein